MSPAVTNPRVRHIGALAVTVSVFAGGAGAALADPASHAGNYFARVAAGTRPDDRAGLRGPNAPSFMEAPRQGTVAVRPDDRGGIRGAGAPSFMSAPAQIAAVRPDDRAGALGIGVPESVPAAIAASARSGFDWVDAGIGAGSTLALILTAGGMFLVSGRRRGPARRSSAPSALHG